MRAGPPGPTDPLDPTDPEAPGVPADFSDNVPGTVYYAPVRWLQLEGITSGYTDGTFRAGQDVTREEFVAFLYRASGEDFTAPGDSPFPDVDAAGPHFEAIAWASSRGIVNGYPDGDYRPQDQITRAEVAKVLHYYNNVQTD